MGPPGEKEKDRPFPRTFFFFFQQGWVRILGEEVFRVHGFFLHLCSCPPLVPSRGLSVRSAYAGYSPA